MTVLDVVLVVKIIGTGLFVALPLLLLPGQRVSTIMSVDMSAMPYLRMYGVAILALLVGYTFGFSFVGDSQYPLGVICMGIVSNGLGALVLMLTGAYRDNLAMTCLIGAIAIALVFCLALPDVAMMSL